MVIFRVCGHEHAEQMFTSFILMTRSHVSVQGIWSEQRDLPLRASYESRYVARKAKRQSYSQRQRLRRRAGVIGRCRALRREAAFRQDAAAVDAHLSNSTARDGLHEAERGKMSGRSQNWNLPTSRTGRAPTGLPAAVQRRVMYAERRGYRTGDSACRRRVHARMTGVKGPSWSHVR